MNRWLLAISIVLKEQRRAVVFAGPLHEAMTFWSFANDGIPGESAICFPYYKTLNPACGVGKNFSYV